jgi:hypothetical protein
MSFATTTVEIAFGSAPLAGTYSWTDVTDYVKSFNTDRGRDYELDQVQAGKASIVLDNADGRFTPGLASSPYFPNVIPRRRIRIRTTDPLAVGGTTVVTPTVDNMVTANVASGTTLSWSHAVGAGSNRVLVVDIGMSSNGDRVGTITYGGVALTSLTTAQSGATGTDRRFERWYLVNPTVGTATIAVTLFNVTNGNTTGVIATSVAGGSTSLFGVDQTTPFGTGVTNSGTGTASGNLQPATVLSTDLVLTGVVVRSTTAPTSGLTNNATSVLAGTNCYEAFGQASGAFGTSGWSWSVSDVFAAAATPFHGATVTTTPTPATVFTGFAESWQQSFTGGGPAHSEVVLTAVDGFKVLGQSNLRRMYVAYALGSVNGLSAADALFAMQESQAAVTASDLSGLYPAATIVTGAKGPTSYAFGASSIVPYDPSTSLYLQGSSTVGVGQGIALTTPSSGPQMPKAWGTLSFWFRLNSLPVAIGGLLFSASADISYGATSAANQWSASVSPAGVLSVTAPDTGAQVSRNFSTTIVAGTSYYFYANYNASGTTFTLYSATGSSSVTFSGNSYPGPFATVILGQTNNGATEKLGSPFEGLDMWVQDASIWLTQFGGPAATNLAQVGFAGYNGFHEGSLMSNVLQLAGWPTADIDSTTITTASGQSGLSLLAGSAWAEGANALQIVQEAATSAGGYVFINGAGQLVYHNRQRRLNQAAKATLQESSGTGVEGDIQFHVDDSNIRNPVVITTGLGASTTVADSASQAVYGNSTFTATLGIQGLNEALDAANWRVSLYRNPKVRCDTLTIEPVTSDALWAWALGLEIGDRVTVAGLPASAPSSTVTFLVEAVKHKIQADGATPSWSTSIAAQPRRSLPGTCTG